MADDDLARGRAAFQERAWQESWGSLSAADAESPLGGDDLALLSLSAYLSGHDQDSVDALSRAFHAYVDADRMADAAQSAFWLAFMLTNAGELALGNGWATRSRRLVDEHCPGGVEDGFLVTMEAHRLVESGEAEAGLALAEKAVERGESTEDPDLRLLALVTTAGALLELGRGTEALARMDEVMVAVSADELTPVLAGLAYCMVISACIRLFDLRRAREWTAALTTWCDTQPGLVPYRGQCLVHRAQIMMLQGAWADALDETESASQTLRQPAVGEAHYLLGELHRLRGEFEKSEDAFRQANAWGRRPEPGLVRLRVAQGKIDAAATTIRRLFADEHDGLDWPEILVVCVEVMVQSGDLDDRPAGLRPADRARGVVRVPAARGVRGTSDGHRPAGGGPGYGRPRRAAAGMADLAGPRTSVRRRAHPRPDRQVPA